MQYLSATIWTQQILAISYCLCFIILCAFATSSVRFAMRFFGCFSLFFNFSIRQDNRTLIFVYLMVLLCS